MLSRYFALGLLMLTRLAEYSRNDNPTISKKILVAKTAVVRSSPTIIDKTKTGSAA